MKYILSIDQGTTSSRAILFDNESNVIFKAQMEVKCYFPNDGWVEQNPNDIYISVLNVINECLVNANITYSDIDSIGITNQRETTIIWNKKTGVPIYNAIVWQSRQSLDICNKWEKYKDSVHKKTGLLINPYFSASKIRFILDNVKDAQKMAENGELCFGTVDTWLMYKLSEGKIFKTDVTNASRTMLFNIKTLTWDEELLEFFNIPKGILPSVHPSSYYFGNATILNKDLKIMAVAGDQQASLFGQNCFSIGESKNTYGTGCFMLMNIGKEIKYSKNGLLTTIAWQINDEVYYALEGSVFIGGAAVQWLRDELNIINNAKESEEHAYQSKEDNVYFVPAFVGLGAPYWDNECRGSFFGLTRSTNKNDIIRAVLNSIDLQVKDIIKTMEKDTSLKLKILKVDGGATDNNYLMQYQADILNVKLMLPNCLETTALGVAYLSGLASGYYKSIEEIKNIHKYKKVFYPKMNAQKRKEIDQKWKKAIKIAREFK